LAFGLLAISFVRLLLPYKISADKRQHATDPTANSQHWPRLAFAANQRNIQQPTANTPDEANSHSSSFHQSYLFIPTFPTPLKGSISRIWQKFNDMRSRHDPGTRKEFRRPWSEASDPMMKAANCCLEVPRLGPKFGAGQLAAVFVIHAPGDCAAPFKAATTDAGAAARARMAKSSCSASPLSATRTY